MMKSTGMRTEQQNDMERWFIMMTKKCIALILVALLAMKWFVNFLTKYGFKAFGYYRIVVGTIIIVLLLTGHSLVMVD